MAISYQRYASLLAAGVLLALCVWMYWPGSAGPTILDDYRNLDILTDIEERSDYAGDYIFGNRSGVLGRSVSMFSFVIEELYLGGETAVRKRVNIGLHALIGALLMWLFSRLLAHAGIAQHQWFAVLGGALWLFSPLYVSTVLYVVQRMAMLATLFMLLSCIVYTYWRQLLFRSLRGVAVFALLLLCIALAVFSKENGALVLPVLVALEVLWFGGRDRRGNIDVTLRRVSLALMGSGVLLAVLGLVYKYDWIQSGYRRRDFTLSERLLTQARIVWDYLAQLLWPDVQRMGVFHDDYGISTSLTQPSATLYAVLGWALVAVASLLLLRWRAGQLMVAAIAVFVLGHAMESTVWPLELYFEHRNYFPGVGVFLLLLAALGSLARRWPQLAAPLLAWLAVWVVLLAVQTGSQVQVWSSAPVLRLQHVTYHPESARANREMAMHLAGVGALESAFTYSRRADAFSSRERAGDRQLREIAMHCLSGRTVPAHLFAELGQANPQRPFALVSGMQAADTIFSRGGCTRQQYLALADRMAEIFLREGAVATASANFFAALAGMENRLERYDNAYAYMEKSLALNRRRVASLLMQLHFATALGKEAEAEALVQRLQQLREKGALNKTQIQTLALYR